MKNFFINSLLIFIICNQIVNAQTEHAVQPKVADSSSGAPNNNHFCYINQTIQPKNKLFLFFPGTGGVPFNYKLILKHAANLGYHSVGLTYPNADAINTLCAGTTDTTCHSRARLEVFDGLDRSGAITVDTNNCIERRTLKLLQYLHLKYPLENWNQYFLNGIILWDKIIVSGHSQGGGHAGIISKIKRVDRVVMFAAMDWMGLLNRNADWITWKSQTPDKAYFGFTHEKDESVDFNKIQITWDNYGMSLFGDTVLVDFRSSPYSYSHQLFTKSQPANDPSKFHGSVVADAYTPMNGQGPLFAPVWTYLLENNDLLAVYENSYTKKLMASPNPFNESISFNISDNNQYVFSVYNTLGKMIDSGTLRNKQINLSHLNNGVYLLRLEGNTHSQIIRVVKH